MNNKTFLLLFLFSLSFSLSAQQTKEISHYLFPEFTHGTVLMKGGRENPALLNYNAATEEMVFDQNGQVLALSEPSLSQIDTVSINERQFVLKDNKFAEVLNNNGYKLLALYKCRILPPGNPAAFGGTSQTSSVDSYSSWQGDGRMYDLKLPDDFEVKPYTIYFLDNGSGLKEIKSMKRLKRYYNKRKKAFDQYVSQHKPDYEDPEAVSLLIRFIETNN
ncbi:MAG: hypothetical protein GX042_03840 [Bacteroidales bacterium]|nr:hypothetical protein [Bacteroidales bacterium]